MTDLSIAPTKAGVVSFVVHREHVKFVKSQLERHGLSNKHVKIRSLNSQAPQASEVRIVTTNICADQGNSEDHSEESLIRKLGLQEVAAKVKVCTTTLDSELLKHGRKRQDAVIATFAKWLSEIPDELKNSVGECRVERLADLLVSPYCIYKPMLLLPAKFSTSTEGSKLIQNSVPKLVDDLYRSLTACTGTTHIATNAPIPRQQRSPNESKADCDDHTENFLRRPLGLQPLHGDFGPLVTGSPPTEDDFAEAFWVSTRQNGIKQTWAPRYTMFSRGNVKEKARILNLESVKSAASEGCTAVDMYAGIGYFAFSYAKAGVKTVLCFELNPWSVEGLRRGATLNGWRADVRMDEDVDKLADAEALSFDHKTTFIVFQTDNARATEVVAKIGHTLLPTRHVNCGLLPSSRGSWNTALAVVSEHEGGWLHIHELLEESDIDLGANGIVSELQVLGRLQGRQVSLEHVEKVKSYAPGIIHCVVDVYVSSIMAEPC